MAAAFLSLAAASQLAWAEDEKALEAITVEGERPTELGKTGSANTGVKTQKELAARTVYRPGELLEETPGLIVSQHSGEGKANQYYLRGFNLDHGTDLRTTLDGMVVNQRSHSHGQGWSDLNFMIPELVNLMEYRKGPYFAEEGDMASAGAVHIKYADRLQQGIASVGIGQNGYRRALLADSPALGGGRLLYALELLRNDGPFVHPDKYNKVNGVIRYSEGNLASGFNVTAMAYKAKWNSTDQIPRRAVDQGTLGRFDAIDSTDGGNSNRNSLSADWHNISDTASSNINVYVIQNKLDIFSNFTYFLDDPVNGDQFEQPDKRVTSGLNMTQTMKSTLWGKDSENTVGLQLQNDNIYNGLYSTKARQRLSTTRQDHIVESSGGLYFENSTHWLEKFRTVAGVRGDYYKFKVDSNNNANSGNVSATMASPKLNLIFGPWEKTEYYLNVGEGFHSNDARGTTITVDPKTGVPVTRVTPLVRSKGTEVGVRSEIIPDLKAALSIYRLDFDSELIFLGDAGTTQAGRPSRRNGFELSGDYKLSDWLNIDADAAYARARFKDFDPAGDRIPGAVEGVASLAFAIDNIGPYFGGMQLRYFGPRPLIEDNSVRSASTITLNGRVGYKFGPALRLDVEGFNLTNRTTSAIDYYYTSRLPGEPAAGVNDIHFHPMEPRSFRVNLIANF